MQYVHAFGKALGEAVQGANDVVIEMEKITDGTSEWTYTEQQQQHHFKCSGCQTPSDVLGEYAWCPACATSNGSLVIEQKLKAAEREIQDTDANVKERTQRGRVWEGVNVSLFSDFEGLANHLKKRLLLFPAIPKRKASLEGVSFQRLLDAASSLSNWFGIELLHGITDDDKQFIQLMLQRRHIFIHNSGIADADYLRLSGDNNAQLNQRVRIRNREVKRLLPLIRTICTNFCSDMGKFDVPK